MFKKRALITGASSGIGRALALELAHQGADLVLVARRADRLATLEKEIAQLGRHAEVVVGDITEPSIRQLALATAREKLGGLDILVNNAGVSAQGRFADAGPERLRQIMELNFFSAAELIRLAIPLLQEGQQPIVVNIGSILGRRAIPHNSEYCASKFALHGLSEALRAEFSTLGIGLLVVSPGTTNTEFFDHLIARQGDLPWREQQGVSPQKVARAIVRAIQRKKHEIIPNWRGWMFVQLNRFFPRLVDRLMARYG